MSDIAVIIVDLEKFDTFTEVFKKAGQFCTRATPDQCAAIRDIFDCPIDENGNDIVQD